MKELENANPMRLLNMLERLAKKGTYKLYIVKLENQNRVIYAMQGSLLAKGWLVDLDTYQVWCLRKRFVMLGDLVIYMINHLPYKEDIFWKRQQALRACLEKHKDKF